MVDNSNAEKQREHFAGNFDFKMPWLIFCLILFVLGVLVPILEKRPPEGLEILGFLMAGVGLFGFVAWHNTQPWRTRGLRGSDVTAIEKSLARQIAADWENLCIFACPRLVSADGIPRYPGIRNVFVQEKPEGRFLWFDIIEPKAVHIPLNYWETVVGKWSEKFAGSLVPSVDVQLRTNRRGALIGLPVINLDHAGMEKL